MKNFQFINKSSSLQKGILRYGCDGLLSKEIHGFPTDVIEACVAISCTESSGERNGRLCIKSSGESFIAVLKISVMIFGHVKFALMDNNSKSNQEANSLPKC
ncbi:unnamed protein product [Rhizophagus irregularis]|nr:unnamed protein product [Rhizophagus irregularis]CAB5384032.1 unnamed protein product [Rhizophagus irregularis]